MLDYEKKLHFDEKYEKMKSCRYMNIFGMAILAIIEYILLFFLFKHIDIGIFSWRCCEESFFILGTKMQKADIPYFCIGLLTHIYGMVSLYMISVQNHSVRGKEDGKPAKLLEDGFYLDRRHPMYGTFVILQSGFLMSIRSLYCWIAALVIVAYFIFHSHMEEKKILIPMFGEEYLKYIRKTPGMLFSNGEKIIFFIMAVISGAGFFF